MDYLPRNRWNSVLWLAPALAALVGLAYLYTRKGPMPEDAREVQSIRIWNDWQGFGPDRRVRFAMRQAGRTFEGESTFEEIESATTLWSATDVFSVPIEAVGNFLFVLGSSPLEEGEYGPRIQMTDDYPSRRIELETARGRVVFYSQAQDEGGVPWAAEIGGRKYVIRADVPMRALNVLAPHLVRAASPW